MIKVIMEKAMNLLPEEELQAKIDELGPGWKVVSVRTDMVTHGSFSSMHDFPGAPMHVIYVVIVVLEKSDEPKPVTVIDL